MKITCEKAKQNMFEICDNKFSAKLSINYVPKNIFNNIIYKYHNTMGYTY